MPESTPKATEVVREPFCWVPTCPWHRTMVTPDATELIIHRQSGIRERLLRHTYNFLGKDVLVCGDCHAVWWSPNPPGEETTRP
jgi:hypothetical protein